MKTFNAIEVQRGGPYYSHPQQMTVSAYLNYPPSKPAHCGLRLVREVSALGRLSEAGYKNVR